MHKHDNIIIRFATEHDIPKVMKFIDTHWKKGHILGSNEQFFHYEMVRNGEVSVVLAFDKNEIVGMEGFIPYGEKKRDIMTVIWKVIKTDNPLLGMMILDFIRNKADAKTLSSPGINARTVELYQYLGFVTGKMTHWYRLNPQIVNYKIANINNHAVYAVASTAYRLIKFSSFADLQKKFSFTDYYASDPCPLKEAWYIEHRYFQHPIYQYDVYGIMRNTSEKCYTILVFRTQKAQGGACLRLVDVIGDANLLYQVTGQIDELLRADKLEYVDFYEKGMEAESMERAGWEKVVGSGNIIPNYFSPFVQENIDILYFSSEPSIMLFKADGDQDRPS